MKRNIQQQIDRTLECLGNQADIEVNPVFIDALSDKIAHLRTRRGLAYRSRAFYPVAALLMVMLNAAALMGYFGKQQPVSDQSYDALGVVASEYGIGQSSYAAL